MNTAENHAHKSAAHHHDPAVHWQWPAVIGCGVLALVLGTIGFFHGPGMDGKPQGVLDAFYNSMRLFHMHFENAPYPLPWELQIARFLAPLVLVFTIFEAFLSIAHHHRRALLHRTKCGHVVICGLGRKGLQLAKKFREQGRWVVVIESDASNELLQECADQNILCWIGDAGHRSQLQRARVHCAILIIAVTGDDGKNVEVAVRAAELCVRSKYSPQCFVHIVDRSLRRVFREHRVFKETGDSFRVAMFDFYENCALALFQDHALDGGAGIRPGTNTKAHLVIVGFGQMGESVLLQAARIGHFADDRKLRATIIDPQAAQLKANFYGRYPRFDQTCAAEFVDAECESPEVAALVKLLSAERDTVLTFAVCCDDDTRALTAALSLKSQLQDRKATILVRTSSAGGLTTLLAGDQGKTASEQQAATVCKLGSIEPFGFLEQLCVPGAVLHEALDHLAMKIHQDFVMNETKKAQEEGRPPRTDAGVQPWPLLEEDYKNSNRQQALHLQVKLRAVGCRPSAPDNRNVTRGIQGDEEVLAAFSDPDEIEVLAKMEHARWCADKLLGGWEPAKVEDRLARKHPDLVPWNELMDKSQEKDRDSVTLIPQIVTVLGRKQQKKNPEKT